MNVQLLDKTRKINKLIHNSHSQKLVFNDICNVLAEVMGANTIVISKKGKILALGKLDEIKQIKELSNLYVADFIEKDLNERLLGILSTKENVNLLTLGFGESASKNQALITNISIAGERLGTLFVYKNKEQFGLDDIILCEYCATVIGLEMLRSVNEESAEHNRKLHDVKSAVNTLSFSEREAIVHVFKALDGNEGVLIASKIADSVGITRSVIVNALRKFQSAGIIESRSAGMKGTHIKVLNEFIFEELREMNI